MTTFYYSKYGYYYFLNKTNQEQPITSKIRYSHLSNNQGGCNKREGVQKLQNQLDFFCQFLSQNKDLQLKMTVRKIIIRFCTKIERSVMKSINMKEDFYLCRVEFSKIGKRDVTFIREIKVPIFPQNWTHYFS